MSDKNILQEYALAIVAVLIAIMARFALDSSLGNHLPYVTFFIAVAATTWYAGLSASLTAVVLSGLASNWFFMNPRHSLAIAGVGFQVGYATYFAVSLTIVGFGQAWRRAQQQAQDRMEGLKREVTERKQAERLLHANREELRQALEFDEAIMAGMGEGLYTVNSEGLVTSMNPAAQELFGWTSAELLGRKMHDMTHYKHRDGTPFPADDCQGLRVIRQGTVLKDHEDVFIRKDGTFFDVVYSSAPIRAGGTIIGLVVVFRDLSENKQLLKDLHESEERLRSFAGQLERLVEERTQELVQSQDRLRVLVTELNLAEQRERKRLAGELHDYLAQLLVLCRLNLGQVRRTGLPPKADETIKETEDVLNQALNYCRTLMAELSPPVLQEHGLPAGLKWLAEQMERHGLRVTVDVGDATDILLPEDSAVLLFQSVRELLMNALKHAESQNVSVHLDRRDGKLRIEVHDDGVGFDLAAAAAATPTAMSSKFGLFSLRERMRALGGWFHLESAPGKGTTATLALPLDGDAASETRATSEKSETGESPNLQLSTLSRRPLDVEPVPVAPFSPVAQVVHEKPRVRVLLVDDHAMVRQGLRSVLDSYADIEVVGEAWNGEEAVAAVETLRPAVVLMDINMPKLNGIEATARIKSRYPDITVIGLSVNAGGENEAAITKAGAALLLNKEAAVEELYRAIRACKRKSGLPARPRAKTLRTVPD
jgi:PAS domain S-box-containing protein